MQPFALIDHIVSIGIKAHLTNAIVDMYKSLDRHTFFTIPNAPPTAEEAKVVLR